MAALYEKKNHDYGNSFEENLDAEGSVKSGITRLSEKISRLKATEDGAMVSDESMEDTLIDIANYAVMNLMWLRKQAKKEKFVPKAGQRIWYVDAIGEVSSMIYWGATRGGQFMRIGNCFETEEEAKPYANKFKELFKR